jgi:Ca-activated chloride channel family protein
VFSGLALTGACKTAEEVSPKTVAQETAPKRVAQPLPPQPSVVDEQPMPLLGAPPRLARAARPEAFGTASEFDDAGAGPGGYVASMEPSLDRYDAFGETGFVAVRDRPLSTFSIDVDTASYSNLRRFLNEGTKPPRGAVRIEEMLNFFRYPKAPELVRSDAPLAVESELFEAPWQRDHRLVRIAIDGRPMPAAELPPRNLVLLIDVSGSMDAPDRLPWVKRGLAELASNLRAQDRVAIVVYAGASGLVLEPTPGDRRGEILAALDRLSAGGPTAGAEGIVLAYQVARRHFDSKGINRIVLATDGDFNVGVTNESDLVDLIEKERASGVFLSVLGFGRGNLNDAGMEKLADHGNGNYAYVDSLAEARKVLVREMGATLQTIAKDVKIQVEINPLTVAEYRLIGYENRTLAAADFANDTKDAGDLGAGHAVTALYEVLPTASADAAGQALRYQRNVETTTAAHSEELLVVKLRWKLPEGDVSTYREIPVVDSGASYAKASGDFKFAAAVASFGMLLRGSPFRGQASLDAAMELATDGLDFDPNGLRAEFIDLVRKAKSLAR